jgi:hypothetical protein
VTDNRISLHIGAHKTATSHLQRTLKNNEGFCSDKGLTYLPNDLFRKYLSPIEKRLKKKGLLGRCQTEFHNILEECIGDQERLFLSEENILVLAKPFGNGHLYPKAEAKFKRVRDLIGPEPINVYLAIRDYAQFIPSIYIEHIRNFKYVSFEDFMGQVDWQCGSWISLIERIAKYCRPEDSLYVWTYEDYSVDPSDVYKKILNCDNLEGFSPERGVVRAGLSAEAFAHFEKHLLTQSDASTRSKLTTAQKLFPRTALTPAYQPLPIDLQDKYSLQYQREVETLRRILKSNFIGT